MIDLGGTGLIILKGAVVVLTITALLLPSFQINKKLQKQGLTMLAVATFIPNLNAALSTGLRLENIKALSIIRQNSPDDIRTWFNPSTTLAVFPGEPIIHNGVVCISAQLILPQTIGNVYTRWVADFYVGAIASNPVLMNDLVYWQYDANGPYTGSGAAVHAASPTNGFILGRAGIPEVMTPTVNGSNKCVSLAIGTYNACRLRVNSLPFAPTTYGTIGTYA